MKALMNARFFWSCGLKCFLMCSIWQSFLVFFSWIIIHEDILGMSLLLWKMQSKVSSAYSIVGINALHVKKCRRWSLLWVCQKIRESCRKSPLAPMGLCILPSYPAEEFQHFLSLPSSLCSCRWKKSLSVVHPMHCWRWVQAPDWSTHPDGS